MKFKFINPTIDMTKNIIHKMPYEKRLYIATIMWEGIMPNTEEIKTKIGNGFYNKLAGRNQRKFQEALAMTSGKAWKLLEEQTQKYLDEKMTSEEKQEYKNKLINTTYKKEPDKIKFLQEYFNSGEQNKFLFKQIILDDIIACRTKEYKEHLDFWVGEDGKL